MIRKFVIPPLNFNVSNYLELIDWQMVDVSEPPLLKEITIKEIETLMASGVVPVMNFPIYPCLTHAVESCVKLVTEASVLVCGENARGSLECDWSFIN